MVIHAAFEIIRQLGVDSVNVRRVAEKLHCSTQPVMYQFPTMEELKKATFAYTDTFHTRYIMDVEGAVEGAGSTLAQIGLQYIRFAHEEPQLFRFLFQSDYHTDTNIFDVVDTPAFSALMQSVQRVTGLSPQQSKSVFTIVFFFVHGYASLVANNAFPFEEDEIKAQLVKAFTGATRAQREETSC
ncbi:TetR/AcrR family transcriptional regulator [Alloscardovia criceti]|uniref:TetR/AcrR family transcriptional regulator n=1 Tax=Alloscardovia criceti TaxID=356828 RepID=UPI00037826AE|nr:TetR/AcrR family transcriptional regulator [Alloscardovia criceti]